jgi:hypothetical protein
MVCAGQFCGVVIPVVPVARCAWSGRHRAHGLDGIVRMVSPSQSAVRRPIESFIYQNTQTKAKLNA